MHDRCRTFSATELAAALVRERARRGVLAVPSVVLPGWFEMDVCGIEGDELVEFEIKVSRSDFFRDASKARVEFTDKDQWGFRTAFMARKWDRLQAGDERGPGRFWIVVPGSGLVHSSEIPEFSGLLELRYEGGRLREHILKPAPLLHTGPVTELVRGALQVALLRFAVARVTVLM